MTGSATFVPDEPDDADRWRRRELAIFLRSRREALAPDSHGFDAGARRRAKGLRREEVASLIGVSVSWYTKLEQGLAVSPSPRLLDRVAEVLRLTRTEHAHLLRLGLDTEESAAPIDRDVFLPPVQAIIDAMPASPAFVLTPRADYVACNAAARAVFGDFEKFAGEGNQLVALFLDDAPRRVLPDWQESARRQVAMFRAAFARNMRDPGLQRLVDRLLAHSPEFRELWARYELPTQGARLLEYRQTAEQMYLFQHVTLLADLDCQYRVEIFHPGNPATARWIESLLPG